ncbi:MAG: histidine phosphatase family protein [Proteobacteria bacterium]|nr:MAG: histidine phosphatase family protein [Pseudomonadota bacterium]PIE40262.1 MAG: histidine phosphatase family protein [Gammaproteobacteria bacterium]
MLTRLVFLRHGKTVQPGCLLGHTDAALSKEGLAQLRQSAGSLNNITRVISSPLQRAAKFAQEFAQANQLVWETQSCWAEYHFGDWDGMSYQLLARQHPEAYASFLSDPVKNRPANAESVADFSARVIRGIVQAVEKHPEQKLLIVTHGGVIRCAVAWCLGLDFVHQKDLANIPFQRLQLDYASLTRISVWNEDGLLPKLDGFNQTVS